MRFSERALAITPSATLAFDARVKELVRNGIDVIGFCAGEPDFDTPRNIQDAGVEAIRTGITRYTAVAGLLPLREAICQKMWRDQGLKYEPKNVLVSCGAKQSLYNAFQVLCGPGDEVVIPRPYWVSYVEQVLMTGAKPVLLSATEADGFRIRPENLKKAITPRTRVLVLNSPCNPTGTVYSRAELQSIAEIAVAHDLVILSDEVYEKLVYDGDGHVSIAQLGEDVRERTIVINGVSKTYAMTGWRIGYAVGDARVIGLMTALQGHVTSNAASIAQHAAIAALNGPQDHLLAMRDEFARRRNRMVERLNRMPGMVCRRPEGAFYAFVNVSGLIGQSLAGAVINSGDDLANVMLDNAHVAVVPGSGFGMSDYVRLSYATSMDRIEEGMDRMQAFLESNLEAATVREG